MTSLLLNLGLTSLFGIVWYRFYADIIIEPFFRKGNWLVIGIYVLLMHVFIQIYGGYRVEYLKRGEALFSIGLASVFINAITPTATGQDANLREALCQKGIERARQFTWESAGGKLHKIYETLLDAVGR